MDNKNLDNLRHSCAHLLAAAVLEYYPKSKLTLGPSIENGFYYDVDFGDIKISESDFSKLEQKMHELVKKWHNFEGEEIDSEEAIKRFKGNQYKEELIKGISERKEKITVYKSGEFSDLCRGGHVENPKEQLKHFKLLSIAGAYWRGSEKNKMLTRIYGTAFPSKVELDQYLKQQEEAKKRDHRKLGAELDLFSSSQLVGPGLILWHPQLSIVRDIVERFWKDEHYKHGYKLVYSPHIGSMDMFVQSRHLSKYMDYMFPIMFHDFIEGESAPDYHHEEVLKPMNCPGHIQIYKFKPKSYRELPLRMGELGTVYRYERSGVLHGMTRVRGFTQDDSHIFCRPDQVIDEVKGILNLTKYLYNKFGFKDFQAYISTRPEKHLGSEKMWTFAEESLKKALDEEKIPYKIEVGGGAFYGPKIDSKIKDSLGREWQLGTIQFDFNQPDRAETTEEEIEEFWKLKAFKQIFKTKEKVTDYLKKIGRGFDVNFINQEGKEERVVMIHRTIFGSMERFFGILIEHYGGAFPLWLAPVQVTVLPISEKFLDYAQKIKKQLDESGIRNEVNLDNKSLGAKIRQSTLQKVPFMIIIGDKEIQSSNDKIQNVTVRTREGKDLGMLEVKKFINQLKSQIENFS